MEKKPPGRALPERTAKGTAPAAQLQELQLFRKAGAGAGCCPRAAEPCRGAGTSSAIIPCVQFFWCIYYYYCTVQAQFTCTLYYIINFCYVDSPVILSPGQLQAWREGLYFGIVSCWFFFPWQFLFGLIWIFFTDLQFKKYLLKVIFIRFTVHPWVLILQGDLTAVALLQIAHPAYITWEVQGTMHFSSKDWIKKRSLQWRTAWWTLWWSFVPQLVCAAASP